MSHSLFSPLSVLLLTSFIAACSLSDDSDDSATDADTPATQDPAAPEEEAALAMTAVNYRDFLSVALKTRPVLNFEGFPVGLFPTYLGPDDVDEIDQETELVTHQCDGVVGSAITTQVTQVPEVDASGTAIEEEPIYGFAGDYTETVLSNCTRDGFTHTGTVTHTLTVHEEYPEPANIGSLLTYTVADSVETQTFSGYTLEKTSTGESINIAGDYSKTLRYESEAAFNNTANRTTVQYLDQVASTTLSITTNFATGTNLNQQFANYVEVETDSSIQWSGALTTVEGGETYTFTIAMPAALTKTESANSFAAGQLIITQDTAVLTATLSKGNQAIITLDLEGDGTFELEETITLSP